MKDDRLYTAYAAESEHDGPEPDEPVLKLVPNAPVPVHPREADEEGEFLGVRRTCELCGNRYLPWPGHEVCPSCGAGVKQP